jgi:signal transduction histidine kinase
VRRVIHEIRNHLAIGIANVEAFRDGVLEPSPKRLAAVLQALREVERLLLDLTPAETAATAAFGITSRTINARDVIENEAFGFEAAAADRGLVFAVEMGPPDEEVCLEFAGDPTRVAEIVNNIVGNAVRYTPHGGRVDVACRRIGSDLVLTVVDDGPGIRKDEAQRIFEPGFRGAASVGTRGSGQGLALVKRFAEEQGGSVSAVNVAGRGACFTVRLPGMPLDRPARRREDGVISLL